ncbi:hypothetical protein ABK040_003926 [Willaertia magna]
MKAKVVRRYSASSRATNNTKRKTNQNLVEEDYYLSSKKFLSNNSYKKREQEDCPDCSSEKEISPIYNNHHQLTTENVFNQNKEVKCNKEDVMGMTNRYCNSLMKTTALHSIFQYARKLNKLLKNQNVENRKEIIKNLQWENLIGQLENQLTLKGNNQKVYFIVMETLQLISNLSVYEVISERIINNLPFLSKLKTLLELKTDNSQVDCKVRNQTLSTFLSIVKRSDNTNESSIQLIINGLNKAIVNMKGRENQPIFSKKVAYCLYYCLLNNSNSQQQLQLQSLNYQEVNNLIQTVLSLMFHLKYEKDSIHSILKNLLIILQEKQGQLGNQIYQSKEQFLNYNLNLELNNITDICSVNNNNNCDYCTIVEKDIPIMNEINNIGFYHLLLEMEDKQI